MYLYPLLLLFAFISVCTLGGRLLGGDAQTPIHPDTSDQFMCGKHARLYLGLYAWPTEKRVRSYCIDKCMCVCVLCVEWNCVCVVNVQRSLDNGNGWARKWTYGLFLLSHIPNEYPFIFDVRLMNTTPALCHIACFAQYCMHESDNVIVLN